MKIKPPKNSRYTVIIPHALQCCIDLNEDVLRIGTTGTSVPFLKESELKEKEEMEKQQAVSKKMAQAVELFDSWFDANPDP